MKPEDRKKEQTNEKQGTCTHPKKPYAAPQVTPLGDLEEITLQGGGGCGCGSSGGGCGGTGPTS